MGAQTPYQVGQLSPDGNWMWDGARWVPSQTSGQAPPPPQRSRTWLWWVGGGCALLLVTVVGGGIWALSSLVNAVQHGQLTCMPSDFPRYPGAMVTRDYTYVGTGVAPGDSRECQETLSSNDDVATVTDFYASKLASGDWHVTANDKTSGQIRFARTSKSQQVGAIQLLGRGEHTVIEIKFDS
jgi:hypothetical protein